MATVTRPAGGRYLLEIDGAAVTALRQFSGLGAQADIAMGKGLYGWLKAALGAGTSSAGSARNGAFKVADFNKKVKWVRTFSNALITEFSVPKLDAASKDVGFFDIAEDRKFKHPLARG